MAVSVTWQAPAPSMSTTSHVCTPPSLTVTVPVGAPPPGSLAPTSTPTVMGWPTTGPGVVLVMLVVVSSCTTVTAEPVEVTEEAKFVSPL